MHTKFLTMLRAFLEKKYADTLVALTQSAQTLKNLQYPFGIEYLQVVKKEVETLEKIHRTQFNTIFGIKKNEEYLTLKGRLYLCLRDAKGAEKQFYEESLKKIYQERIQRLESYIFSQYKQSFQNIKSFFLENIDRTLQQDVIFQQTDSDLLAYIELIKLQLIKLTSEVNTVLSSNHYFTFLDNHLKKQDTTLYGKFIHYFTSIIKTKLEPILFRTGNNYVENFLLDTEGFLASFHTLNAVLEQKTIRFNAAVSSPCQEETMGNAIIDSSLDNLFFLKDYLTHISLSKTDIVQQLHNDAFKFSYTEKLLNICMQVEHLLKKFKAPIESSFSLNAKLWFDEQDKSLVLADLIRDNCYNIFNNLRTELNTKKLYDNVSWLKSSILAESVFQTLTASVFLDAASLPLDTHLQLGKLLNDKFPDIELDTRQALDLYAQYAITAIEKMLHNFKTKFEVEDTSFDNPIFALAKLQYEPLPASTSSGKQNKAHGSGFYFYQGTKHYLKHVSDPNFVADDIVEVLVSKLTKHFNQTPLFAQCHLVKTDTNEVFLASQCAHSFSALLNTEKRSISRMTPEEKVKLPLTLAESERTQLSNILALALMWGDYDCNPGNIGKTPDGIQKIDHGWALENICREQPVVIDQELDFARYFDRFAPTNTFRDYKPFIESTSFYGCLTYLYQNFSMQNIIELIKNTVLEVEQIYDRSKAPSFIDKVLKKTERTWIGIKGFYTAQEIRYSIFQRVGLESDNDNLTFLAHKIAQALFIRLQVLKLYYIQQNARTNMYNREAIQDIHAIITSTHQKIPGISLMAYFPALHSMLLNLYQDFSQTIHDEHTFNLIKECVLITKIDVKEKLLEPTSSVKANSNLLTHYAQKFTRSIKNVGTPEESSQKKQKFLSNS